MTSLQERIVYAQEQQQLCGEYIRSAGPDIRGAIQGAEDWIMEEALLRLEQCHLEKE